MIALVMAAMLTVDTAPPAMQGSRLRAGEDCYAILRDGQRSGSTTQTIRPVRVAGRRAWDIVVHQRIADGGFDMRDHLVVDRATLLPITFESRRGADRTVRGWRQVTLHYAPDRVMGTKETANGTTAIDVALDRPVWDGNLWGVTFAALPLRAGGHYTLPFWHYDKGYGTFTVDVTGRERVDTLHGKTDAWVLAAGDDPAHRLRYVVAVKPRMEIGYAAGRFAQTLSASCPPAR